MLRALVLLLALANAGFFAWTRGWLDGAVGVRAIGDREPERLARQVRPEALRILPPDLPPISANVATAAPPSACLEAGPFNELELAAARAALQSAVPARQWADVKIEKPGSWLVYMGRYLNREGAQRRADSLRGRDIEATTIDSPPELDPGLSLGRFDDRALAEQALARIVAQGIRTARVVEIAPPTSLYLLRVDDADAGLAQRLGTLRIDALGKGFAPCVTGEAGR